MSKIRVTCRNEEEVIKVLAIAEKEGYTWDNNAKATSYRPCASYPYDLVIRKGLYWGVFGDEKPRTARDFIDSYNTDHAEPCGISQKIKKRNHPGFHEKVA